MKQFLLQLVFKLLSFLPLSVIRAFGALVGVVAIRFSKRASKRLRANIIATGMCVEADVEKFANANAREMGKTLVETIAIAWQKSPDYCLKLVFEFINFDKVEKAAKLGPVLFLTPHIGNFEVAVKAVAAKIPDKMFNILYKPDKDPAFSTIMLTGRTEKNINPVPTTRYGVAKLLKSLKEGGFVGILPDNVASGGDGIWTNFFGKNVFATTLAAKMSLYDGVTTFVVSSKRVNKGFIVEFIEYMPKTRHIPVIVQEIYKIIETMVLNAPTQYYWSYDRFRAPQHAPTIDEK